jgi:RNA polymerase sigma-70 factor (ECF subfamily)
MLVSTAPAARTTDADAIAASRRDPHAFAPVFDRHFAAIHRFLAARVGTALADELAADVFVRAFDARGRYDTSFADARPWLYAIATNLVHRQRRAERRRLAAYARLDRGAVHPGADEGAAARLDAAVLAQAAAAALADLKRGDRDALLLVAWADLTYEETARALGVPVGTVRSRIHRARAALRAALSIEEDSQR